MDKYDVLKIENQLCFPLYACGKEVTRLYKPILDELDLTYTQYVSMMVIWEHKCIRLKDLGDKLYLDSGTLTPLLKKLESKGYISRIIDKNDSRNLMVEVTEKGMELREKALEIPGKIACKIDLDPESAKIFYDTLYKILNSISK
ncbi:MAG: MarR family transcriptional regulator [Bacilli bacterium]|nr:MarR family transcriptional regulator [Bacilli bacterium]